MKRCEKWFYLVIVIIVGEAFYKIWKKKKEFMCRDKIFSWWCWWNGVMWMGRRMIFNVDKVMMCLVKSNLNNI